MPRPLAPAFACLIPAAFAVATACSDYAFEPKDERPDRPGRDTDPPAQDTADDTAADDADDTAAAPPEEVCDGADNDDDGEVDEGYDANGDGVTDCFETTEEVYCTPFDDFAGWSYTGTGDWHVEQGMLTEGRAGSYAGLAYVSDMGSADRFLIQVDTAWNGNANDLTGIAWGVQGDAAYVARWDDPQGYYGRYTPTGGMDVSRCDASGCTPLVADSSADLYWPEGMVFVTWSVRVDGADVEVVVDGDVVLRATVPELAGTGPGVVGVYSNDNDGGVWFDDFCVWAGA